MKAAGARENIKQFAPSSNKLNRNEEAAAAESDFNSLQQQMMPSAKRSFSAEGTVKRGSKLRTTVRNEFFNGSKNTNPDEDSQQKKTNLVVLKRYNSAFPKDFFGNVRQQSEQVQNKFNQNDSSAVNNQGIIPTGYTYSIRQDSYQFLQQQQQQQQQQLSFQNENQGFQNSKLTRQQMQNLNQSQYLHQNMYPLQLQQGVKQMIPSNNQAAHNFSNNQIQIINQPYPSSQQIQLQQQQYKQYRCQSEADSPIKKSAYDILENNSRIPQMTQSEQKIQYMSQIAQQQIPQQMNVQQQNASSSQSQQQFQQQILYLKSNSINNSQSYNQNNINPNANNYPSSQIVSGENSPLKEQKFNNQAFFSTASSQWKHIFSNNNPSSQQVQHQIPKIQQYQPTNSIIKNQLKIRQNIPPKPQFQLQNFAHCKTEQNEDSLQSNSNSVSDNPRNLTSNNNNNNNNNNIDAFRNTINNDTPKFTSDDSTTLSSQQNQTNSFTAAIIQQQLMQRIQNSNPNQIQNKSQFSSNQNEQLRIKIVQQPNNSTSYHIQTKQKRKSQATRSQSEIKLSNSIQYNQKAVQINNLNKIEKNHTYQEDVSHIQNQSQHDKHFDQIEEKKNNLNYATFSSSALLKINHANQIEQKEKYSEKEQFSPQQPSILLQSSSNSNNNNSLLNSLQLQQKVTIKLKQSANQLNSSSGSGEDKLNFNQSRQFFDFQNESQNGHAQSINGTQNEINILDNKQLLNKDYSCFQFNLQPIPGVINHGVQAQNGFQNYHLNSRNTSPEDDRNGKENLINQINNIFQNKVNILEKQHSQKSNYLNILNSQQIGLTKKVSSNSSENANEQNFSNSEIKNGSVQKFAKNGEESKYTNEFIEDHIRHSEKLASRSSQLEVESPLERTQNLSRKNSNSQIPKPSSMNSSAKKKNRIKVIYPAQMDPNNINQSSNMRTQSEANLSGRKKTNSIIKPFQCQNNQENKISNSNEVSKDNFSPVHFHRLNTEADKDSENVQSQSDFTRKVFSVSSFQQLDSSNHPDSSQQKKRVRKPKSYHSQSVFNLSSSDTKKKIGFFNQSQVGSQNQESTSSNSVTQVIENTQISNYPNGNYKEKQQDQIQNQNQIATTTLPKIYTHQNTVSQNKQNFTKPRMRFNSYQKSKTETSPKDDENQDNFSQSIQFQKQALSKKNIINLQPQSSFQQTQKNNQTMKLSDFISLTEKKPNVGQLDYEQKVNNTNEDTNKQKDQQIQVKANPFLQSNLNPSQFEFSFRNNQCQKESEKQISQQINKHKIQSDSQQTSSIKSIVQSHSNQNSTNNNHNNQIYDKSQQINHNQLSNQLCNFKLHINNQQEFQCKDATSIKLSSSQLKQPNKYLSEKKQLISQNLKTDYS